MLVCFSLLLSTMLALSEADLPVNCRTVVFSEARTPLACVMITRNTLNTPGLQLDTINWGTVGQLSADTNTDTDNAQDTVYNDLLKSWVVNPVSTGNGLNPTVADAASALDPDLLPGACRSVYISFQLVVYLVLFLNSGGILSGAISWEVTRLACVQLL